MQDEAKLFFRAALRRHRGKAFGTLFGLCVGVCVLLIGFWHTFFLLFCGAIGLMVGSRFDGGMTLREWWVMLREAFPYGARRLK